MSCVKVRTRKSYQAILHCSNFGRMNILLIKKILSSAAPEAVRADFIGRWLLRVSRPYMFCFLLPSLESYSSSPQPLSRQSFLNHQTQRKGTTTIYIIPMQSSSKCTGGIAPRKQLASKAARKSVPTTRGFGPHVVAADPGDVPDLIIKYGPNGSLSFPAHRVMLSRFCKRFELIPTNVKEITLEDDVPEAFEVLLEYCYRGR